MAYRKFRDAAVIGFGLLAVLMVGGVLGHTSAGRPDDESEGGRRATVVPLALMGFTLVGVVIYLSRRSLGQMQSAAVSAEQNERLRTTLASIGDAVISTDRSGGVTYLNAVAESLTGWTSEEAAGVPLTRVFRIVNESTRQTVENPAMRALREGVIVGLANHTVLIAKDGAERPIDDSAAPIRSEDGAVVGCVLVFRDISERKREEDARAERSRLVALRSDVSAAFASDQPTPDALRQCCEALVRHLDAAFARVWTLDSADAVLELQASAGLYTHLDGPHSRVPVGQFKIGRIASRRQPHLTNTVPDDPEVSDRAWAREAGMVAFAGYPLAVEDRVVGVLAMFARRPLSEAVLTDLAPLAEGIAQYIDRRRAEAGREEARRQIATTLESIADGFMRFDRNWRVVYANAEAERITRKPRAEMLGQSFWELFPATVGTRVEADYRRAVAERVTVELETYYGPLGGWYAIRGYPTPDDGLAIHFRDITESKRAAEALRKSEERYRTLFASAPMAVFVCDRNAVIQHYNAHAAELWGREPARGVERHCGSVKLWLTDDTPLPHARSPMVEVLRTGIPARNVEVFIERPDGSRLPVLVNFAALKNAEGEITGAITSFVDITERKRAEEALRASDRRLRFVMDSMPQKIFTATPAGEVDYFNPIWTEFTGLSFERIRDWGWTQFIHPDDVEENVRIWKRSIGTGEPFRFEHRFRRRDGVYRWHTSRAVPMRDEAGGVVLWIGSNTDIHDVKHAEQTARFVAGVSAALVNLNDPVSTLQKVASMTVPAFADWCAVDVVEEGGEPSRVAVTHADPVKLRAYRELLERYPSRTDDPHGIPHVLRTGEPDLLEDIPDSLLQSVAHDEEHLRLLRGMGLESHILVPIRSRGRTLGVLTFITAESGRRFGPADLEVAQDLAHRAAVAIENADLYLALREADRRKDEFLATLAHELRNPLAPIRNGLQVLRLSGDSAAAVGKARTMMERQLGQMVRLVDDLLDVSRISQGKLELRKERIDLAGVVSGAVETSRPVIDAGGHELAVVLPAEPVVVDADVTRLGQVFANLLNNAAKYSERGGRIRLIAERRGGDVAVSVKDTGVGIPRAMLPKVFDLFTQVDRSLEKSQGGLGIGLTLVKRLVEMHGGSVEARSEGHGRGSEFVVRLPMVLAAVPEVGPPGGGEPVGPSARRRILVADDNADSAESLGQLLELLDNEVRTANDGAQAVDAAEAFRPDVILLDIGMPKLNGYDACRRIREQPWGKRAVIIALTGWGQEEDRRRSQEAGFDHHMVKPVDPAALEKLLARLPTTTE